MIGLDFLIKAAFRAAGFCLQKKLSALEFVTTSFKGRRRIKCLWGDKKNEVNAPREALVPPEIKLPSFSWLHKSL